MHMTNLFLYRTWGNKMAIGSSNIWILHLLTGTDFFFFFFGFPLGYLDSTTDYLWGEVALPRFRGPSFFFFFKGFASTNTFQALSTPWSLGVLIPVFFFSEDGDDWADTHCPPSILLYCMYFQSKKIQI